MSNQTSPHEEPTLNHEGDSGSAFIASSLGVKFAVFNFLVFLGGVVVSANLSRLVGVNEQYDASWWKVAFAMFLAFMFSVFSWMTAKVR